MLVLMHQINNCSRNVEILRVRGTVFFLDGNYEEASKDFNDAVEFYPTEELYYYQGLAFYHRGELDDSVKALEKSLQIRANQPEVMVHVQSKISIYFHFGVGLAFPSSGAEGNWRL